MNKREENEINSVLKRIYCGILFNNQEFANDYEDAFVYEFDCPEYKELIAGYALDEVVTGTTDLERALHLLHYLSAGLAHCGYYDNHVECNSLALMDYSFNHPERGINCLNKSKILEEACLAFGIYARRVSMMPYSPYDMDNHVVTEVFSKELKKWVMLDPTTDGFCIDSKQTPLSCMEIRESLANNAEIAFVHSLENLKWKKAVKDSLEIVSYYAKNVFYFIVDKYSAFGERNDYVFFIPKGYDINAVNLQNLTYRMQAMQEISEKELSQAKKEKFLAQFEEKKQKLLQNPSQYKGCTIEVMKRGI